MVGCQPLGEEVGSDSFRVAPKPQKMSYSPAQSTAPDSPLFFSIAIGLQRENKTELGCLLDTPTHATLGWEERRKECRKWRSDQIVLLQATLFRASKEEPDRGDFSLNPLPSTPSTRHPPPPAVWTSGLGAPCRGRELGSQGKYSAPLPLLQLQVNLCINPNHSHKSVSP